MGGTGALLCPHMRSKNVPPSLHIRLASQLFGSQALWLLLHVACLSFHGAKFSPLSCQDKPAFLIVYFCAYEVSDH